MGIILTATENEVYKKGLYPLRVANIEAKNSTLTGDDGVAKDSVYLRWSFDILKRGFEGKMISANSSTAFGPSSKGRKWAEALLDRQFHVNEPVDTDDLIGCTAMATIGITVKGDKQYNEIEALAPMEAEEVPPQTVQRVQQTPKGRVALAGYPQDEEDIPFEDEPS